MRKVWLKQIQSLLKKAETEDLQGALALISFHLDHASYREKELESILDGIRKNIPIPYIIGYTLVCGLKIIINRDVLNPGPETVTLIERAGEYINRRPLPRILDLCTGSGSIAVVLAKKCSVDVVATDISAKALAVARRNAVENEVDVNFLQGNLFAPVNGMVFGAIITNPPYVKSGAINQLPGFVRNFAPLTAINGGEDGLFFHKTILTQARDFLCPGGSLFTECEDNQDAEVEEIAINTGWKICERFPNKQGKIRGFRLI